MFISTDELIQEFQILSFVLHIYVTLSIAMFQIIELAAVTN